MSRTEDGWTPLHSAARWNKVGCAKLLIAAGSVLYSDRFSQIQSSLKFS